MGIGTRVLIVLAALAAMLWQTPHASAGTTCTLPYTLQDGQRADAIPLMADFNALVACFSGTAAAGINNDITALNGLTTPILNGQLALAPANTVKCNPTGSLANVQDCSHPVINVIDFGAKCDGSTDDSSAINAALASGSAVIIPNAACRVLSTIIVPAGSQLSGSQFNPQEPATGSRIQCGLSLTPCVNIQVPLSGSSSVGGQTLQNLSITRDAGTIPAGVICVLDQGFKVTIVSVSCNAHAIGFYFKNTSIYGITTRTDRLWTCNITDTDIVQDAYPELTIANGRFGCNGTIAPSTSHNNFIKLTGGPGNGPNTLWVVDSQFNDINNPGCWINWSNITASANAAQEYKFIGNHYENTGTGGPASRSIFCSDGSLSTIQRVWFSDNTVLDNNGTAFVWSMGTSNIGGWIEKGNNWGGFATHGWNLSLSGQLLGFISSHEVFNNPLVTVTGSGSGSQSVVFEGDAFDGGLTIAGSFGTAFPTKFSGVMGGGNLSNTATTPVEIDIPGFSATVNSSSLGISFGGTPATASAQIGRWQIHGDWLTQYFYLQLSALGGGSGVATVTGLPFTIPPGRGVLFSPVQCTNMAGLTGPVFTLPNANNTTAALQFQGATGNGNLTNANFTSTSQCQGSISYQFK